MLQQSLLGFGAGGGDTRQMAFVAQVQPKIVYTLHGFAKEFAATLRTRGIEAWAIGQQNQLELSI